MTTDQAINDEIPIKELIKEAVQMDKLRLTDETKTINELQQSDQRVVAARRAGEVVKVIDKIEETFGQNNLGDTTRLLEKIAEKGIEQNKVAPLAPSSKPPVADL